MGLCNSKKDKDKNKKPFVADDLQKKRYRKYSVSEYDKIAIENLEKNLKHDPNTFILNMLLMSFMFFEDYEKEIKCLAAKSSKYAQKLNEHLKTQHQKQLIEPDQIMAKVNSRVKFISPQSGVLESLVRQRMFIVDDTIHTLIDEETDIDNDNEYLYLARIEEQDNKKRGFVRVQLDTTERRKSGNSDDSEIAKSNIKDDSGISTAINSDSEGGFLKSSIFGNLEISERIYMRINRLPLECVTPVEIPQVQPDANNQYSDEKISLEETEDKEKYAPVIHQFLNSKQYMLHFKDEVFPRYLGEVLGFDDDSIAEATSIPGAIHCNKLKLGDNNCSYEIIPSILICWPGGLAFEQEKFTIPVTIKDGQALNRWMWPTEQMITDIKNFEAVIVPRGFIPREGKNPHNCIEWEVVFPKAEQYLELRMSHAQMRLYLFLVTLFKKFIEPKTQNNGLLMEHIRILMLWECKTNYILWPEDQLGTKLKFILQKLCDHLENVKLQHYFAKKRNVLRSVPTRHRNYATTQINKILETPALYMLSALKQLKYVKKGYYPMPNLNELYRIITSENSLQVIGYNADATLNYSDGNSGEEQEEVIDLKAPLQKFDLVRTAALLKFFTEHFLAIAEHSRRLKYTNQAKFYLKQADYLATLLEVPDIVGAQSYQQMIKKLEDEISSEPTTTKNNTSNPPITRTEISQGDSTNNHFNKQFNENASEEPRPSTSKVARSSSSKSNRSVRILPKEDPISDSSHSNGSLINNDLKDQTSSSAVRRKTNLKKPNRRSSLEIHTVADIHINAEGKNIRKTRKSVVFSDC